MIYNNFTIKLKKASFLFICSLYHHPNMMNHYLSFTSICKNQRNAIKSLYFQREKTATHISFPKSPFLPYFLMILLVLVALQYYLLQYNRQMIYNPLSTKSKQALLDKQGSTKFFKKFSTDQNEKNFMNFAERVNLKLPQSTKNIISLTTGKVDQLKLKPFSKHKKSQVNFINLSKASSKLQLNAPQSEIIHHSSQKQSAKTLRKESSAKNLKLTTSTSSEFPNILVKSVSQTTLHRKMDDNKLKLLQKMGMKKKAPEKVQKLSINNFKLGKKLGSGRFGNVYLAEQRSTKNVFAIKVMNKTKIKQAEMEDQVFWQIKLQMYMNHPNVLKLYGFFDDAKNIYLILQYCSQCLFKDFRLKTKLSEQETSYYGKQVISSLKYMHNENIIHRDIKPENIMIEHGVLKMSDFGWSTYSPLYKRSTFCGTVDYVPPEIVEGSEYDERVDIWALGVLMYELASGHAPFQTKDENITYDKIVNSECKYPQHFSKDLREMIGRILDKRPERRPNLDKIEHDPWFDRYKGVGRYISKEIWSFWDKMQ